MSCGRQPDEAGDELTHPTKASVCARCQSSEPVLQVHTSAYCSECVCKGVYNKFRKSIDNLRKQKQFGKSLIVASSGSTASLALQSLISQTPGLVTTTGGQRVPPIFAKVVVCHVSTSARERDSQACTRAKQHAERCGLSFVNLVLSAASDDTSTRKTATLSLESALVGSTLQRISKEREAILMSAETATSIAVNALSGLALGQGYALGEISSSEYEQDGVWHFRPLTNCLSAEIEHWASVNGIESTDQQHAVDASRQPDSIQALCDKFVHDLDSNYSSTSSVVAKTVSKLGLRSSSTDHAVTPCSLCGLPAQPEAEEWRKAITIAHFDGVQSPHDNERPEATTRPLCYACHLTAQDLDISHTIRDTSIDRLLHEFVISD